MTNHAHRLATAVDVQGAGVLMKALGQRYVQYVNRRYRGSGTLWEGRFRSCLTEEESYRLACRRCMGSNLGAVCQVIFHGDLREPSYRGYSGRSSLLLPHTGTRAH